MAADRLKALLLLPYPPYPPRGGGQQRTYHIARLLGARHDLHLLCFTPSGSDPASTLQALAPLEAFATVQTIPAPPHTLRRRLQTLLFSTTPDMALRGQDPTFASTLAALLKGQRWDIIQAESIEMAQYGRSPSSVIPNTGPRYFYDAFNAEYLLQRRACLTDLRQPRKLPAAAYSLIQWRKLRHFERSLARRFDRVFAVSQADRRALQHLNDKLAVEIVPNGVDTYYFRRDTTPGSTSIPDNGPYLLFTGTLDYRPNIDAITWFVDAVWSALRARHPTLRLRVVGQRPVEAVQRLAEVDGVDIIGAVDDVRPWFMRAAAYVLPMRVGGGVRLKLLETWSMELPCVTSTLGAEGIDGFEPGSHALIADTPNDWLHAIDRLLSDPALATRLTTNARRLVETHYDWRPLITRMEQAWLAERESTTKAQRTPKDRG